MTSTRKPSELREKDLRSAIMRISHGKSKSSEKTLTVAAVAREAGVSTALIYNHYPHIAEIIREAKGRSSRTQRDKKNTELKNQRAKNKTLRNEIHQLHTKISKLASINEKLLIENNTLKSKIPTESVVDFPAPQHINNDI